MDGTVMSFMDNMNTFVAVNPSASATQRDLMLSSLCLSVYEAKLKSALAIYNRFAVRPRLIHGMCATQEFIWQKASPIEALVLSTDPTLFSREYIGASGTPSSGRIAHCTLWCAMKKVRLTIHASGHGFQVMWPAKVSETDGSTTVFVPPINERGEYIHALASQRACRYVLLEQWFWMDACPEEWVEMVRICLELDRTVPHSQEGERSPDACTSATVCLATPSPLGVPRLPSGMSSYLADRATCSGVGHCQARFSELQVDDAHSFIASTQVQSCPAQAKLHPTATVLWRWDSDPSGRTPSAFYHVWGRGDDPSTSTGDVEKTRCASFVLEDDAIIFGGGDSGPAVRLFIQRVVFQARPPSLPADVAAPPTAITSSLSLEDAVVESREYIQDMALSMALPRTVNSGLCVPALGSLGAAVSTARDGRSDAQQDQQHSSTRIDALAMDYGRYLPSVAESIVGILGHNQAKRRLDPKSTSTSALNFSSSTRIGEGCPSSKEESGACRAVKLTTRVDNVGTFTALSNGVCRAVFDDRVIVTLIPDPHDSDEGLVCEMRGRDGELRAMRVSQCVSTHPVFEYLSFLLPFRNFARLSEEDQRSLSLALPQVPHYERTPVFTGQPSEQTASLAGRSSYSIPQHGGPKEDTGSVGGRAVTSVDVMMLNTSGTLARSGAARTRAMQLLQDLA